MKKLNVDLQINLEPDLLINVSLTDDCNLDLWLPLIAWDPDYLINDRFSLNWR